MITGTPRTVDDLDFAGTAFRSHLMDAAVFDGVEQLGTDGHTDIVLFFLEAVASGNAAATCVGVHGMHAREIPQNIESRETDALRTQMAGGVIDDIKGRRLRFGKIQLSPFDAAENEFHGIIKSCGFHGCGKIREECRNFRLEHELTTRAERQHGNTGLAPGGKFLKILDGILPGVGFKAVGVQRSSAAAEDFGDSTLYPALFSSQTRSIPVCGA